MHLGNRYVIGDIHGCCKTFRYLVEEKIRLQKPDSLYLLGDYIDRGPDSKGVLDFIFELKENGFRVFPLLGNHEDMLLKAFLGFRQFEHWMLNGGTYTLTSFNTLSIMGIPQKYIQFIRSLPYYYELDDFFIVHAGLNFEKENPLEDKEAMLWIRDFLIDKNFLGNRKLVHGHTPVPLEQIIHSVTIPGTMEINLDGGCAYKDRYAGLGNLVGLSLDTMELFTAEMID